MSSRLSSLLQSPLGRFSGMFAAAAVLAGCGGSVVDRFEPQRIVSLGDEYSYIAPVDSDASTTLDGRKFTVNRVVDGAVRCNENPLWNQRFVEDYGFSFPECNVNNRGADRLAVLKATIGATALQQEARNPEALTLAEQIAQVPDLGVSDMVLLLIGANDIWNAFQGGAASDEAAVDAAALEVYNQVLGLVNRSSKVVLLTVPDQGMTPAGRALGEAASARLSALTERFNTTLRRRLNAQGSPTASGRNVGLVLAQGVVLEMQNDPSRFGLDVVDRGACRAEAGLSCDESTADSNYRRFLYADGRYLSTPAQDRIANAAITRARNNPF